MNDPVFNNREAIRGTCDGMELFNDFTYTASYNQELTVVPIEAPDFRIPCFNGKIDSFSKKSIFIFKIQCLSMRTMSLMEFFSLLKVHELGINRKALQKSVNGLFLACIYIKPAAIT